MSITINNRTAKFTELNPYCHHVDAHDFMEVTEWTNVEGFDVTVSAKGGDQRFSLTYGQWEALQALVAYKE